ncbi:BglG family transcription antiterminator [Lacticaseibacillus daqingensis]|uniref:BglG family transcription antiterminator n=1 Tax=Lacticaseibacillus daqingensis TaxID=2486014 RepID=UPI000F7B959C|nr:HTH domain-containing protein [Lacticaseibacillus daqingensis]
MRYGQILERLEEAQPAPVSRAALTGSLAITERTLSSDIRTLNDDGVHHGFTITTVRGRGYALRITDPKRYAQYCTRELPAPGPADVAQRVRNLEMLLLLAGTFITSEELAQRLNVSVPTIKSDMKQTRQFFAEHQLNVMGRAHYGSCVTGTEEHKRRAIIDLFRAQLPAPMVTPEYSAFVQTLDEPQLRAQLTTQLQAHQLTINDALLKNVIEHTRLLIYRMTRRNYITPDTASLVPEPTRDARVDVLVDAIVTYIHGHYDLILPQYEVTYLRNQMIGKLSYVDSQDEARYKAMIAAALRQLDRSYATRFAADEELKASLLIHLATLFKRLSTNHQLKNPLLDDIYMRYANVINTALDFMQLMLPADRPMISKDELGYIAIYFAASLEKQKVQEMEAYRNVVVLTDNGRGTAYLLENGLRRLFPNAKIQTLAVNELNQLTAAVNLVVATVAVPALPVAVPVIEISQILSDRTMTRVENAVHLLHEDPTHFVSSQEQLMSLFDPAHFAVVAGGDYLTLLRQRGAALEADGSAAAGFAASVLEREERIDTVYEHGIAGPHPMSSFAQFERIDVTLLQAPLDYEQKRVQAIFLINLRRGHLVLHQEISRMMIALMNDATLLAELHRVRTYPEFIAIMTQAINRR